MLQFATARIGAVLVTINPAYRPFELKYVLKQSDAVALFLVDRFKSSDYFAMLAEVCPELAATQPGELSCRQFPEAALGRGAQGHDAGGRDRLERDARPRRASRRQPSWTAIAADAQARRRRSTFNTPPARPAFPRRRRSATATCCSTPTTSATASSYSDSDRICIPVPFYHCFGCVLGTLCAVVYGAAMVVPAESFDPTATLDAIEHERATSLYGVPTMFIAQLQDPSFARAAI